MRAALRRFPVSGVSLAAGAALSPWIQAGLLPALCAVLLFALSRKSRLRRASLALALLAAGLAAGGIHGWPHSQPDTLVQALRGSGDSSYVWVRGRVISSSAEPEGSKALLGVSRYCIRRRWHPSHVRIQAWLPVPPLLEGGAVEASLRLEQPPPPENPGEFDYRSYLARKGIRLTGYCRAPGLVRAAGPSGFHPLARYRRALRSAIEHDTGRQSGIVLALLMGERGLLTPSIRGNLQRAGLFHLVALSGLHVGLLLLLLYGAAALLRLHPRVRDFACLVILGGYGLVVGTHPSLLRALLMAGIYLVAKILGRPQAGWRAWLFTLILLLLVRPAWAMDTGFQLTFAATLGILLMMPLYPARLPRGGWSGQVLKFFWMGFAAQLFVLPILADAFHRVSWSGWLATPLASLPIFPLLATGLLYMAGGAFVPGLHTVLGMLLSLFARIFMWLPFHLGAIQHAGFFVVEPWAGWILLYFCALGLIVSLPRAWKGSGWAMAALLLCGAWCFPRPFEPPPRPEMAVLDVGQASCQVVLSPRSTFLVDAGTPGYKGRTSASSVIEPFLAREGVRHIDGVILTHWDSDHSGALPDLLRDIPIGWIAYPATDPPRSGLPAQIAALCRRRGVPLQPLHRYETMGTGRLSWDILNPSIRTPLPGENNRCIVAQTLLGRVSFLFTGDIEARAESDLVARRLAPPAQVLVAPHHGSKTSSTPRWLAHVRPLFVCFSVGRRNRYGHPAPEIVDRYKNMRAEISRTDRDGGVLMVPRGGLVSVFRMRNGDWSSRLYGVK